ncbi:MAG: DNA polymerase III subunit gamma/tau [Planctomycetota bacterium]
MSYVVLARKYRPKEFAEVAGQEVVMRTLRGAIEEGRIGHAYLFHGPRGTGKTTSARLFAKALNCEHGPAPEPCGKCERCLAFDAGAEADLLEIDAASNTGVDHIRDLRDQAGYVPLRARFKVFLVDEVHMLSKAAFNALLKTLEEPPPHVKFLFATTELHKVPDTIVSRCQVLRLSPLPEATIAAQLDKVFALEGIQAEPGVTVAIAARARGGMRDALSMADQLIASVGLRPTLADQARLAGEGGVDALGRLVDALLARDRAGVLRALPTNEGGETELLGALLDHVRTALVLLLCGADAPMVAGRWSDAERATWRGRAEAAGVARLEVWLQELLMARERMGPVHMHPLARVVLEATLLDLCRPEGDLDIAALALRLAALEERLAGGAGVRSAAPRPSAAPAPPPSSAREAPPAARSAPERRDPERMDPERSFDLPRPAEPAPPRAPRPGGQGGAPASERLPQPSTPVVNRVTTNSTADAWGALLTEARRALRGAGGHPPSPWEPRPLRPARRGDQARGALGFRACPDVGPTQPAARVQGAQRGRRATDGRDARRPPGPGQARGGPLCDRSRRALRRPRRRLSAGQDPWGPRGRRPRGGLLPGRVRRGLPRRARAR